MIGFGSLRLMFDQYFSEIILLLLSYQYDTIKVLK